MADALKGIVAFITGAAHGMGEAIARKYAGEGATLALADRDGETLSGVAETLGSEHGAVVRAVELDVRDREAVDETVGRFIREIGPLDIVVNAAGLGIYRPFEELTEEDWDTTFDVNVKGTFLVCRAVTPYMVSRGAGQIINIASLAAKVRGFAKGTCYTASKYAVEGFSRSLGVELRPEGVRVCTLCPGTTDTYFRGAPTGNPNWMQADDVASAALYVATQRPGVAVHEVVFSMISESW